MKMFKNKIDLSLPPLPKPPTSDQMIEDIRLADSNDPVFLEESCKRMFEERTKLDIKFETVKEFIGASHSLNCLIKETEEKLSKLQNSREELEEITQTIKEEAIKALS